MSLYIYIIIFKYIYMYICMHTRVIAHVWNLLQTLEHPCICMHEIYPIAEVAQPLLMGILVAPHGQI